MASVSSQITKVLSGANASMVKLDDNSIVSLADYQKLFDAAAPGEEPVIAGILAGSDEGMVQLGDGRILSIAQFAYEFQQAGGVNEPTIAKSLRGADDDTVETAGGQSTMAFLYQAGNPVA